jgi:hypothetical protein
MAPSYPSEQRPRHPKCFTTGFVQRRFFAGGVDDATE